jgi:hypothetical protein
MSAGQRGVAPVVAAGASQKSPQGRQRRQATPWFSKALKRSEI